MCGTNNIQHNSVEDIVDGILEIALSLRRKYHPITIFVSSLLPRYNNWSINRLYINEINHYLCYKSKSNGVNFINHTDWTLQDGSLKPNLFYTDKLHLIEERNVKLAVSIYSSINHNTSINDSVSISSKLFACHTGLNLKQEDIHMLPCNISLRNSVCNPDKPIVKYVRKSIFKSISASSVRRGKPIGDSNVRSSKLVSASASSVRPSKHIHGSNVRLSKPITSSNIRPSKPISRSASLICASKPSCGSNVGPSKPFSAINVRASKSVYGSNVSSRKPLSVSDVCPGRTISVSNVCLSNSVREIYVHLTKSVSASNICSGKPVCGGNRRSSNPICRSNVCRSKPNNANILPCKPVVTSHISHVNSSLLKEHLFFILFLSILIFPVL